MSIIMYESERSTEEVVAGAAFLDPAVRHLLDHVAAELAVEYIHLMEAAAEAELPDGRLIEGGQT